MKVVFVLVALCCATTIGVKGADEDDGFLIWRNRSGQTMEARFMALQGTVVTFENRSGQRFHYEAGDLDVDGQSLAKELSKDRNYRGLPPFVRLRCMPSKRAQAIAEAGGLAESEAAVVQGLTWLAAQQNPLDGSFGKDFVAAMTGLSLLAYLGHCETPESSQWGDTVINAALYLIELSGQGEGLIFNGEKRGNHLAYEHAIATYALAELYSMTSDSGKQIPGLEKALKEAVKIIVDGQTDVGGWLYGYRGSDDSDLSLSGWQLQALRAARHCGDDFAELDRTLSQAMDCVKTMQDNAGAFTYRTGDPRGKPTLTGAALYNLHMWGESDSREYARGMTYLADQLANPTPGRNFYAPYYNTLAFFAHGGTQWRSYHDQFMPALIEAQNEDGSFFSENMLGVAKEDNQLMHTAWAIMMMEVYYRYARTPDNESVKSTNGLR